MTTNTADNGSSHFTSLRDHLLIAMPNLRESYFANTVTYLCEHTEDGAMGLVINQPTDIDISEVLEQLEILDSVGIGDQPVLSGGPVQIERGFVLHPAGTQWDSTLAVSDQVSMSASRDVIAALAAGEGPERALITLGYAGWGEGQLEQELADNAWLVVPADSDILFELPYEQRWHAAARRLGVDPNLIADHAGHA